MSLLLILNRFHASFWCFHCRLGISNCGLGNTTLGMVHAPHTKTQYWVSYRISYYLIYARCFSKVWFFVLRSTKLAEASSNSQKKHRKIVLALFKVDNEVTKMPSLTSFWCSYCLHQIKGTRVFWWFFGLK